MFRSLQFRGVVSWSGCHGDKAPGSVTMDATTISTFKVVKAFPYLVVSNAYLAHVCTKLLACHRESSHKSRLKLANTAA